MSSLNQNIIPQKPFTYVGHYLLSHTSLCFINLYNHILLEQLQASLEVLGLFESRFESYSVLRMLLRKKPKNLTSGWIRGIAGSQTGRPHWCVPVHFFISFCDFLTVCARPERNQKKTKKKQVNRQRQIYKWIDGQTDRQTLSWPIINLLLFNREHLQVNELISLQSPNVPLSISGFSLQVEQITWKNVKIKVNELEGPPEDNDLCQGEHIVSRRSWKTTLLIR